MIQIILLTIYYFFIYQVVSIQQSPIYLDTSQISPALVSTSTLMHRLPGNTNDYTHPAKHITTTTTISSLEPDSSGSDPDDDAESFSPSIIVGTNIYKINNSNQRTMKSTTRSPVMHETEETTTRRQDYDGGGSGSKILPVQPTRWPISTHKPKINTKSTTTTMTPYLTSRTTRKTSVTSEFDPKVIGIFVCPPMQSMTGVIYICKHPDSEDTDDCSNGGVIGTVAMLTCDNFYKAAFGQGTTRVECQSNHRWSVHRMFGCNIECGISSKPRKSYIVNGVNSDRISWPWHATIFRQKNGDYFYICGGTLISKSIVLTAAHCVTNPTVTTITNFNEFKIILAAKTSNYTENLLDKISGMYLYNAQNIVIPHSYNGLTFESDIAIIRLDKPVELSDYTKPVCFPYQNKENSDIELLHLSPGTFGQTIGFGVDETGNLSRVLKETNLPVISHRDCGDALDRFPSHSQFCAGYRNGTSVCNGDSGGGIFFSEGTGIFNRFIIQGIVSFGNSNRELQNNCSEKTFAVFTKVGGFAAWVQQYVDKWESDYR